MTTGSPANTPVVSRWHANLLAAAAAATYLLVVMGGVVCVSESGSGCPDWPLCYGSVIPPMQVTAVIEYLHRFVAVLAFPFIVAAALVSWRRTRSIRWVSLPPVLAVVLVLAVSGFGAMAVLRGLPPELAAIDLGLALLVLALMVITAVVAFAYRANPALPDRLSGSTGFAWLAYWTLGAVYLVLVSSVLVAGKGSLTRCLGWPMWRLVSVDLPGWPQPARLVLAGMTGILIFATVVQAWHTQIGQPVLPRLASAAGFLFLVEMVIGLFMLAGQTTALLLVAYTATAAALWVLLVALAVLARMTSEPAAFA